MPMPPGNRAYWVFDFALLTERTGGFSGRRRRAGPPNVGGTNGRVRAARAPLVHARAGAVPRAGARRRRRRGPGAGDAAAGVPGVEDAGGAGSVRVLVVRHRGPDVPRLAQELPANGSRL